MLASCFNTLSMLASLFNTFFSFSLDTFCFYPALLCNKQHYSNAYWHGKQSHCQFNRQHLLKACSINQIYKCLQSVLDSTLNCYSSWILSSIQKNCMTNFLARRIKWFCARYFTIFCYNPTTCTVLKVLLMLSALENDGWAFKHLICQFN